MGLKIDIAIIGGGMITHDQILPSVYHLQRMGILGDISICALSSDPLRNLKESQEINEAFIDQDFTPYPSISESPNKLFPTIYLDVLKTMRPRQIAFVATPDQIHYQFIMDALKYDQHVICVKPLVLKYDQAEEIKRVAYEKGLFVGIEYHKRFDRRSLLAKRNYVANHYGEFILGEAKLIEPYSYRFSNFQNWFTCDQTDPFVYVGCHYVDLVYFITGLRPVEVSSIGIIKKFPNGNEGYMWSNARVRFENDALLSVNNGLGYPDKGAGAAHQSLVLYCEGQENGALIEHNDQYRGVVHCYANEMGTSKTHFHFINPDFIKLVPWEGEGYRPVGYGYDSIAALTNAIIEIEDKVKSIPEKDALIQRQKMIKDIDQKGFLATPSNSYINELVVEAARISIQQDGQPVKIKYGENPHAVL